MKDVGWINARILEKGRDTDYYRKGMKVTKKYFPRVLDRLSPTIYICFIAYIRHTGSLAVSRGNERSNAKSLYFFHKMFLYISILYNIYTKEPIFTHTLFTYTIFICTSIHLHHIHLHHYSPTPFSPTPYSSTSYSPTPAFTHTIFTYTIFIYIIFTYTIIHLRHIHLHHIHLHHIHLHHIHLHHYSPTPVFTYTNIHLSLIRPLVLQMKLRPLFLEA